MTIELLLTPTYSTASDAGITLLRIQQILQTGRKHCSHQDYDTLVYEHFIRELIHFQNIKSNIINKQLLTINNCKTIHKRFR